MALTFYYGSGSPYAWKVWLTLEHKQIPYEWKRLTFDEATLRSPEYLAVNPRGKVPAIVDDDGFALYESSAIAEYLEGRYPERPLLPHDVKARALVRRLVSEANTELHPIQRRLFAETLSKPDGSGDAAKIEAVRLEAAKELARFEAYLTSDWFVSDATTLADFSIYPMVRGLLRVDDKQPGRGVRPFVGSKMLSWMKRVEAKPYFEKTIPPHWKG